MRIQLSIDILVLLFTLARTARTARRARSSCLTPFFAHLLCVLPLLLQMVGGVFKQVATNPLVVLTFLGVLVRLILWDTTAADYDG